MIFKLKRINRLAKCFSIRLRLSSVKLTWKKQFSKTRGISWRLRILKLKWKFCRLSCNHAKCNCCTKQSKRKFWGKKLISYKNFTMMNARPTINLMPLRQAFSPQSKSSNNHSNRSSRAFPVSAASST